MLHTGPLAHRHSKLHCQASFGGLPVHGLGVHPTCSNGPANVQSSPFSSGGRGSGESRLCRATSRSFSSSLSG
ncbi:hypothetical protein Pdw03_3442 [Penicillium digitatum]|uniref:Uncharacterized protein n=1 Tax=Penicillium digitatum TaxID=36651 RepID=A0A7T6XGA5_PENDI|nr:hypothetical protein Pdw03_3442 [Penicillium digitatum]